jgi:hypothetical protein
MYRPFSLNMVSRRGICYDLHSSIHRTTVDKITFIFSSRSHLQKFKEKYVKNRYDLSASLSARFSLLIDLTTLADIVLYTRIESRGFLIINDKGEELCKENLVFNGEQVTLRR